MVEIPVTPSTSPATSASPGQRPRPPLARSAAFEELGLLRPWALIVRGIAAILFGFFAFFAPGLSLLSLVIVWGAYALADGVLAIVLAYRKARAHRPWGWFLLEGAVGIVVGAMTFLLPLMTAWALLLLIGAWAIATGATEILAAVRLRRVIEHEWMLLAAGVLSILFGLYVIVFPGAGALALVWLIGVYAIVFGALLVGLGVRIRRSGHDESDAMPPHEHHHGHAAPSTA